MTRVQKADYAILDNPRVSMNLFHPRKDIYGTSNDNNLLIPVDDGVDIGACFHMTENKNSPSILFFHGNGEIVSDYDDLGNLYNRMGINFMVVDYRGYGRSSGEPKVSSMMHDCHVILKFAKKFLSEKGYEGSLTVMGRSLGSASALELASTESSHSDFQHLIIESGFAFASPLLMILGIDPSSIGFREDKGFSQVDKISCWKGPALIIHAEHDHIIPFSDGEALFRASGGEKKELVKIPGANHNDIFMRGMDIYLEAIKNLLKS
ncbi:Hydrolase (Alpha/beta superfamily protein) [Desulfamplus magnetovallimortis]|uniref:Hydrolase (Alpha/beta superfamily protein) n=1 Tax=Desulfamplus magnetovallimortis TaxID=1246637 RepID=A0A1W1HJ31_9BACT|nr:alpha/beta hydrolase [Desulfamplus magnetovallimortis]SLM32446.1 Hydrolase (Alpha/beta superfamily protein) [Desulfamplus magnetovallimortis]